VGRNTVFIGDVGAHRIESFLMPIYEGERYITTTSYASMGLAVPGAVVASICTLIGMLLVSLVMADS